MDKIPEHPLLKFHPDTFQYVRKDLGLDKPGQMDVAIDLLDDWIKKQTHFVKKDFSREYLERTIIFDKGSVERAKQQLDMLFTVKTTMPHFFERIDMMNDFGDLGDYYVYGLLPKLTKEHHRLYAGKFLKDGITARTLKLCFDGAFSFIEHLKAYDYCVGFEGVIDLREINIGDIIPQVCIQDVHQFITIFMRCYQIRVKGLHVLTTSKSIDILVRFVKQFVTKKVGDRIYVHMTLESLYNRIPKDLLPKEFGGDLKSLHEINKEWINHLSTKEFKDYLKEMRKTTVHENLRTIDNNTIKDDLGISGTFRSLCVD